MRPDDPTRNRHRGGQLAKQVALLAALAWGCRGIAEPGAPGEADSTGTRPDEKGGGMSDCKPVPTRLWKLTPSQYSRTVQNIFGDAAARAGDDLIDTLPPRAGFHNSD